MAPEGHPGEGPVWVGLGAASAWLRDRRSIAPGRLGDSDKGFKPLGRGWKRWLPGSERIGSRADGPAGGRQAPVGAT